MRRVRRQATRLAFLAGFTSLAMAPMGAEHASAAGFYVREHSTSAMASGFAGAASIGPDASHLFYNPATIIKNAPKSATIDTRAFFPSVEINNAVATNILGPVAGTPSSGSMADNALAPAFFASYSVSDSFSVGFGFSGPFASVIETAPGWAGRFHVTKTDMTAVNFNPVFAWRISDMVTIGGGLQIQRYEADLQNAQLITLPPPAPIGPPVETVGFLRGKDTAIGFTAGLLLEPSERTSIGIGYRSRIRHDLSGTAGVTLPGIPVDTAKFVITTPDVVTASISHQVNDYWTLHGTLEWANWSLFNAIIVRFGSGRPNEVRPQGWDDTWSFFGGATRMIDDTTSISAGAGFTSAVSDGNSSAISPDADRITVALGLTTKINDRWTLKASYAHIFFKDVNMAIPASTATLDTLAAVSAIDIDTFGLSLTLDW